MSLYRKYRPQTFAEIVDQEPIVNSLLKQLENGSFTHAYLFSGPRGTGKTSTARIFAKAVNCESYGYKTNEKGEVILKVNQSNESVRKANPIFGEPCNDCPTCKSITEGRNMDVLEIDAASNRGIDEIRELREKVRLSPSSARYKVYIIDEAHQLTSEAFNALLKTLEEPPAHAIFILATTEAHKIPATINSRVQKFEFTLSSIQGIQQKLSFISQNSNFGTAPISLGTIAQVSGGSFRDAEVLYEKVVTVNPKAKPEEVEQILGRHLLRGIEPFNFILQKDTKEAILWLKDYPGDYKVLGENLLETLRAVLMLKLGVSVDNQLSPDRLSALQDFANTISSEKLTSWIKIFSESLVEMKDSPIPSLPLELAIVEACEFNSAEQEISESTTKVDDEETTPESEPEPEIKVEKPETKVKIETLPSKNKVTMKDGAKVEEVKKNWTEILKKVKEQNSSLGVFMRNATPAEIDDGLLMLEVHYQFHKDLLEEPKNSDVIATVIEGVLGKPVRIKGKVSEKVPVVIEKKVEKLEELDPSDLFGKLN